MSDLRLGLKVVGIAVAVVLYPICLIGGCSLGLFRGMNMSGAVIIKDGLMVTKIIEVGNNVHLGVVNASNEAPNSIVVDFRDSDSGSMIKSETVNVDNYLNGSPSFIFDFPKEFLDISNKHVTATIHNP